MTTKSRSFHPAVRSISPARSMEWPCTTISGSTRSNSSKQPPPLRFREVQPFAPAYRALATLPPGPVIELPFLAKDNELHGHAKYMLRSTTHWMPLINGYSDYIPPEFQARAQALRGFPSRDAFRALAGSPPRYAVFHPAWYRDPALLRRQLREFSDCLKPIYTKGPAELYEVLECPAALMPVAGAD